MSALDARMRIIAREELASTAAPKTADGPDRVAKLEQQLTELTARVDELEKSTAAPAKRTARKTTPEPTE